MKQRMLCAVLTAIGLTATAAAADPVRLAQAMPTLLPAHEIAAIVRSAGFMPLSPAMRRGETYVLRAANPSGREVRVVVDARRGEVLSASPVAPAAEPAGPGVRIGAWEPVAPQGYIPPGVYEAGPPIVHDGERPLGRPMAPIPNAPPRAARANPPEAVDHQPPADPPLIMREERGEHGLLPPPPERFPQRAAPPAPKPQAKPAPVKRAAAAPDTPPLPKPRPDAPAGPPADAAPPAADGGPDSRALPH